MKSSLIKVVKAVLFVVILSCMIIKAGPFFRTIGRDQNTMPTLYDQKKNTIDVAFTGSSAVYRFWLAGRAYEEQGITSVALYNGAQDIRITPYLMDEIMKNQDPDLFVVELRRVVIPYLKENQGKLDKDARDSFTLDLLSGMKLSLNKIKILHDMLDLSWEEELENALPLLRFHENVYQVSLTDLSIRAKKDMADRLAALPVATIRKQKLNLVDESEYPTDIALPDEMLHNLDVIMDKAKEYNKEVLFLFTPYAPTKSMQKLTEDAKKYMDDQGYTYLDMTPLAEEIGLDYSTDFYNSTHTNMIGAEKVTTYLAQYLTDHYDIKSDHDAETKAYWEDYVSRWHEQEESLRAKWEKNVEKLRKKEKKKTEK